MKNILVIDDSNTNQVLLEAVLTQNDFNVYTAGSVDDAFKILNGKEVNLILLDLLMPKKSGFDFLNEFNATKENTEIPIIVISAVNDNETINKCLDQGVKLFVEKPVNIDKLSNEIEELLTN